MALRRIALRDFVIVQALELDFSNGFTALTGETGAGKSILIEALQLTLGARADAGFVREGAQRTDISAEFDCPAGLHSWLEESGFEQEDGLLLRRTIDAQGKSRAWVNGTPATATQLRTLGEHLLDIHGQHAWQSLVRADSIRALLDAYAGASPAAVQACWIAWRAAQADVIQAHAAQETLQREHERLQWQIAEVDKLAPGADEWESLNAQHTRMLHTQELQDTVQKALAVLDTDNPTSARTGLARALDLLRAREHLEPAFAELSETLEASLAQTDETVRSLHAYQRHADLDPRSLEEADARVTLWMSLARRYKRSPEELPALLRTWREELQRLDNAADLTALQEAEHRHAKAYLDAARSLSQTRAKAAPRLSRSITAAMQELGMVGGAFSVQLKKSAEPSAHGLDEIAFLVATHPGMTPRPIGKVASGGELSRISLAIAVATSALGNAGTLIFDEVDAGVGGAVAATVGRLMQQLGQDRQVLAVTHLPQVAACAHCHLVVSKQSGDTTTSTVLPVQDEARIEELARMLGGERILPSTRAHAREMLDTHHNISTGTH